MRIAAQHGLDDYAIEIHHGPASCIGAHYGGSAAEFRMTVARITMTKPNLLDHMMLAGTLDFTPDDHAISALECKGWVGAETSQQNQAAK